MIIIHHHLLLSMTIVTLLMSSIQASSFFDMLSANVPSVVPTAGMTDADLFHIPTNRSVMSLENADEAPAVFKNMNTSELESPSLSSLNKVCAFMSLPQLVAILRAGKAGQLPSECYESLSPHLFEYLPAVWLNEIFKQHVDLVFKYANNPSIFQWINSSLPQLPVIIGNKQTGKDGFISSGVKGGLGLSQKIRPAQFGHVNNLYNMDSDCLAKIFDGEKCADLTPDFFTSGDFPNITYFNYTANFKPDVVASYKLGDAIASGHFESTDTKEHFQTTVEIVVTRINQGCFDKMKNETQQYLIAHFRKHLNPVIQREHKLLEVNMVKPMPAPAAYSALDSDELMQHSASPALLSPTANCILIVTMLSTLIYL